jgi:hypothetical protein
VDFGIDGRRRLNDLVDPRMRAGDQEHEAVRGVDSKRQLPEFSGAGLDCARTGELLAAV